MIRRLHHSTRVILEEFLREEETLYGLELMGRLGLPSGTVYPVLRRLKDYGWLYSQTEKMSAARAERRPPRTYYRLTAEGRRDGRRALDARLKNSGSSASV